MIPITDKITGALEQIEKIKDADSSIRSFMMNHCTAKLLDSLLYSVFINNLPFRVEGNHVSTMISYMKSRGDESSWYRQKIIDGSYQIVDVSNNVEIKGGEFFDLEKFYKGEQYFVVGGSWSNSCYYCGCKFTTSIFWDADKGEVVIKTSDEECFDVTVDHSFELHFKAGDEILFGDWVGGPHGSPADLNTEKGLYENSLFYAKHNIGYVQVGNSCPTVYREGDLIYIGMPRGKKVSDLEELGVICTDLWATSFSTARDIDASGKDLPSCDFTPSENGRGDVFLTLEKDTKFQVAIHPRSCVGIEEVDGEEYEVRHYATIKMVNQ